MMIYDYDYDYIITIIIGTFVFFYSSSFPLTSQCTFFFLRLGEGVFPTLEFFFWGGGDGGKGVEGLGLGGLGRGGYGGEAGKGVWYSYRITSFFAIGFFFFFVLVRKLRSNYTS